MAVSSLWFPLYSLRRIAQTSKATNMALALGNKLGGQDGIVYRPVAQRFMSIVRGPRQRRLMFDYQIEPPYNGKSVNLDP